MRFLSAGQAVFLHCRPLINETLFGFHRNICHQCHTDGQAGAVEDSGVRKPAILMLGSSTHYICGLWCISLSELSLSFNI